MPGKVPPRFWQDWAHRRDYLLWLAKRLRFRGMADFYRLTFTICIRNYGGGLITYWGTSVLAAVLDCFPEYDWKPWLFPQVAYGFWDSADNRRNYLEWLGKELGFRRPEAWYQVQTQDLLDRYGGALLHRYASFYDLMREFLPDLDWDRIDRHRRLRVEEVLAWADAHHARHGTWPTVESGGIPESGGSWKAINECLRGGLRGLPGGTTLARFLEEHRGVSVGKGPPRLSEEQVLAWADAHFAAHGKWPEVQSGPVPGTEEVWANIHEALRSGHRGLSPGQSLAQLLAERRGKRNPKRLPPLTEEQVLAWADAYFAAHGKWPNESCGAVAGAQETWHGVDTALRKGLRGLPPGSSLPRLLAEQRGLRNEQRLPPLTEAKILAWADAYFAAHGKWPSERSGPVADTQETWRVVAEAMRRGGRGLPRRSSLARLLAQRRGVQRGSSPAKSLRKQGLK